MPTAHDRAMGFRPDVEGLRAVAVGLVVAYHAGVPYLGGGFVGVDVFFVLSGFLITGLLAGELTRDGSLSFLRFYGRRARRLLPMSAVVLVATAVAFSLILSPLDRGVLAADLRSAALYFANWHFAAASLDYLSDPTRSPVLHYWSLGVEEQFYLVWPVLLVLVGRRAARRGDPAGAVRRMRVALAGLAVASLLLSIVTTDRSGPIAYYGLHTRAWELAAGGLLALLRPQLAELPRIARAGCAAVGLPLMVASAFVIGSGTAFPGWAALGPVVGTVLVVAAGTGGVLTGPSRLLATRPFTYVGRLSYAWYLWHWPCLVFVGVVGAHGLSPRAVGSWAPARGALALLAVAVSFVLSVLSHHLFEDRVRRSAWLAAARQRSVALGVALTVVSVLAIAVILPVTDGAPHGPVLAPVAAVRPSQESAAAHGGDRSVVLTMSPAQARDDDPLGTRDCYEGYVESVAPADCRFGDPDGRRRIALIGDSHAEQWFPAMQRAAAQHHWQLYLFAKTACPMIALDVRLPQFHDTYPTCPTWRKNVYDRLATLPRFDAIVVSHYGSLLTRGDRFTGADGAALDADALPSAWQQAWAATGRDLASYTRRLVLLRDVPKPPTDVPSCLATHGTDLRPCSFSREFGFARADVLYGEEHLAGVPRLRYVDLDDLLCPGDPCPVVTAGGTIVYRDAHHLTAEMSRELGAPLGRRIAAQLAR